jgi:hypothetical protein
VGWGRRRAAPWNGKGGGGGRWNKVGVLTQRRLGYMVDLVRKKSRRQQGGKPRTGSAIGVSTVGNTSVLGLGFNPNRHIQEKQQEKERASRSGTQEAKEEAKWRRLADTVAGARVEARTCITQDERTRKKAKTRSVNMARSMTLHDDDKTSSWWRPSVHRQRRSSEKTGEVRHELRRRRLG